MSQDEVAYLGGRPKERAQVARVENGLSQLRSHPLREMLRTGLGLQSDEFEALVRGELDPERAAEIARPRLSERLQEMRARAERSPEALDAAIRRVRARHPLLDSVEHFCRESARLGTILSDEEWEATIERLDQQFRKAQKELLRAKRLT